MRFYKSFCFATMKLFPRIKTHEGVDHAWFIFNLHIENYIFKFYTTTQIISGRNYLFFKWKTYLIGRPMPCSWWRIPIHSGPLLEINCPHPCFPNPPSPPPTPLAQYCITTMTSTISVSLIQNTFRNFQIKACTAAKNF